MKIVTILLMAAALILTGCKNASERRVLTQQSASNPENVCTMPDGRTLLRITVNNPNYDHYVYFFSVNDTKTVTVNYPVPQGKSSRIQTIILDGETYQLIPSK